MGWDGTKAPIFIVTSAHSYFQHLLSTYYIPVLGQVVKMIAPLFFLVSLLGVTVLRANKKGYVAKLGLGGDKGGKLQLCLS